jgi:IS4 transposase
LVFTTLAPAVLSAQTIMALYRCRWQVELAIKRSVVVRPGAVLG